MEMYNHVKTMPCVSSLTNMLHPWENMEQGKQESVTQEASEHAANCKESTK